MTDNQSSSAGKGPRGNNSRRDLPGDKTGNRATGNWGGDVGGNPGPQGGPAKPTAS